ncbi:MAG: hypothetical protein IPL61_20385 [Myxococcales bacterium]|nr:hypothetical protein [Myxococcales bacterium]
MTPPRLLRVRCARWDQVDAFLRKKLRPDGRLSMKVPFSAEVGAPVTLAIELPNQIVVSLDGAVGAPDQRDRADAAVVILAGARAAIERLQAMLADARAGGDDGDLSTTLAARESHLRKLRQQAAHEVLGCSRGPTLEELRAAWRQRLRREHPDAVARHRSAALRLTAEEAMIHITRAYERMRATVCADHRAVIAGTGVRTVGSLEIEAAASDSFDVEPLTPPVHDTVEVNTGRGPRVAAPGRATTPPPGRATTPPPGRTTAPPPVRTTAPPPIRATAPPPIRATAPPPVRTTAPPPIRATAPPPVRTTAPPPSGPPLIDLDGNLELPLPAPPTPMALELDLPAPPRASATSPPPARAASAATATVEQSLRQARSGPGDRFVRAIRERLVAGDHDGAAQLASAASQVYPRDRRLAALVEVAAAQAACGRGDRDQAVAAVRAALTLDPDGDEARRVLAALQQGAPLDATLIGEAYR